MPRDLTDSQTDRQNVLNNRYAIAEIQRETNIRAVQFEGSPRVLKEDIAAFFEVDIRTVERCLEANGDELRKNGYEVLRGKQLTAFKLAAKGQFGTDIDVGTKTTVLGIFDFRTFLNIGMLLTDSQPARLLRQFVLDIVVDVINRRTGGGTKYVNQRDQEFIEAWYREEDYRKQFTDALRDHVVEGKFKYPRYTDKIYQSIFRERTSEYKKILKLEKRDKVRETFYAEVLTVVASYECGFAVKLEEAARKKGSPLEFHEADALFVQFEQEPHWKPLIEDARNRMASRDLAFRDALHQRLEEYITPVHQADFERFIGEKSKELRERLEDAEDVFKRLKERE